MTQPRFSWNASANNRFTSVLLSISGQMLTARRRQLSVSRRLIYAEDLIAVHMLEYLHDAAGPSYLNCLHCRFSAQAKVDALVAGGEVATRGAHDCELYARRSRDFYLRANRIAIARVADEVQ